MKPTRQPFLIVILWSAFWFWVAAICLLSSMSGPQLEPAFQFLPGDKAAHFVAFAAGGALLAKALLRTFLFPRKMSGLLAIGGVALFGALDEWHQTYTPGRSGGDVGDWVADLLGAVAGAVAALYLYGKFSGRLAD